MAKARTRNGQGKETKQLQAEPKEEFSGKEKGPQELLLDLIDEDPNQPRVIFDPQLLEELATTIGRRGVKNPISVRQTTDKPDRYIINDGARRTRASRMAGKKTIPAFIDQDFTKIDQIIVNAQHADFTPREWALLIDQEEKKGKEKQQIAAEFGKTPPFVTYYSNLLKLPESLADVFNSGRCEDVYAMTQLLKAWKLYPDEVERWLDDPTVDVTRNSIRQLREFLDTTAQEDRAGGRDRVEEETQITSRERKTRTRNPAKLRNPVLQVRVDHRIAHLLYNQRPTKFGRAWIKYEDDGAEKELPMGDIQFIGLLESQKE